MQKDFDSWNIEKKILQKSTRKIIFHESEVWWCSIGLNIGDEEDGKNNNFERPILIVRKFSRELFIGIPLSTKIKVGEHYVNFKTEKLDYSVLLSQARVFSSKRLLRKINKISRGKFAVVKNAYRTLMEL